MDWTCVKCNTRAPVMRRGVSCQVCGHNGFSLSGSRMIVKVDPAVSKDHMVIQRVGGIGNRGTRYLDLMMYDELPEPSTRTDEGWDGGTLSKLLYEVPRCEEYECVCHKYDRNRPRCEECRKSSCSICRYWYPPGGDPPILSRGCNYMHIPGKMCVKCGQTTY